MNEGVVQTPWRVLVVGCGNIAGGFDMARPAGAPPLTHAGAYAAHPAFRLDACIDPDSDRRQAFATHWQVPKAAAGFDALQARPGDFDVVSICSPTALHDAHLDAALGLRPRVVFCEKPLTTSLATSAGQVAACAAAGTALVVNYTRQWDPSVERLAVDLRQGRLGALRSVVGHYNKGILNNGGHLVDLLLRLVGPLELVATLGCTHDFWPDDPTVAALLRGPDGLPVYLNPADARDYAFFELELVCADGVVRMQSGGMRWQRRDAAASPQFKGYKALGDAQQTDGDYPQAMLRAVDEIHHHLQAGQPLRSSGEQALDVQRLCQTIQEAARAAPAAQAA